MSYANRCALACLTSTFRPQGFSPSRRISSPVALRSCFIPLALLGFYQVPRSHSQSLDRKSCHVSWFSSPRISPTARARCSTTSSSHGFFPAQDRNPEPTDPPESISHYDRHLTLFRSAVLPEVPGRFARSPARSGIISRSPQDLRVASPLPPGTFEMMQAPTVA